MKTQKQFVITDMFKRYKILGIGLILAALLVPAAHAQEDVPLTVQVDPGTVGEPAREKLSWAVEYPVWVIDLVFTDQKALEYPPDLHVIKLLGAPGERFVGYLLDAAGNRIPLTPLVGSTATSIDLFKRGFIDLRQQSGPTVFSGIRFINTFDGFDSSAYELSWASTRPTVRQTEVSGDQPPVAEAGAPVDGTAGMPVSFDGSASFDPDGTVDQYDWEFGDGSDPLINGGPTPTHTYTAADTYNVILTVTDNDGLTNTDTTTATIGESSTPPTADAGGPYQGTAGVKVSFNGTASSDPEGNTLQYDWNFGDGSDPLIDGGAAPSHSYELSGEYQVILTVTDMDNETDSDTATATIAIPNQPPAAEADGPYTGTAGEAVEFDGSFSFDPDGSIVQYDWYFGDGGIALNAGPTPNYTYQEAGLYSVTLTVTDGGGLPTSDSTTALVGESSQPPTADANGPYNGQVDVAVTFDGSLSDDPDGSIAGYDWDFGDGNTGTGEMPTHTYAAAGKYIVTLTVTDDSGETDTDRTVATVGIGNLPPRADAGDSVSGEVGRRVTFDGTRSTDLDGDIASYEWEFGDGNTGRGPTPGHRYAEAATYFVTLTVTDSDGATSSDATLATVSSRLECVQECRAERTECLNAADAAKETCIELCDNRTCKRACRSTARAAKSQCRAEFRVCRAQCR